MFLKVIKCLEQNTRKQIDCKRPSSTKQINRMQNIRIEICKCKYNYERLVVLLLFVCAKLSLNYIKQARWH